MSRKRSGEFRTSDRTRTVQVRLTKKVVEAIVADFGEFLLFEGDIAIPDVSTGGIGLESIVIHDVGRRWPNGMIPFRIDSGNTTDIGEAIAHWQNHTPIRFRAPQAGDSDLVVFQESSTGSDSPVGRQGGVQAINIMAGAVVGEIIHEIGHAVGLWHEHSRRDRDEHIDVIFDNIKPSSKMNFQQHITDGDDIGTYDFDSIMHYPPNAFALDRKKPTLRGRYGETFGQRERLSAGDIGAVQTIYP